MIPMHSSHIEANSRKSHLISIAQSGAKVIATTANAKG